MLFTLFTTASAQECVSGRYLFHGQRFHHDNTVADPNIYDFHVDYGLENINVPSNNNVGAMQLSLKRKDGAQAPGAGISTIRTMKYGKVSVKMRGVPTSGVVTRFILSSDQKDEIDWELYGNQPLVAQSNVLYKGIPEHRFQSAPVSSIGQTQLYEIDWKSQQITWSVNGAVVRQHSKFGTESNSAQTPNRWFPDTPAKIKLQIWDAGDEADPTISQFAGGKIQWGNAQSLEAQIEYIDVVCYNDHDQPVPSWPPINNPTPGDMSGFIPPPVNPAVNPNPQPYVPPSYTDAIPTVYSPPPYVNVPPYPTSTCTANNIATPTAYMTPAATPTGTDSPNLYAGSAMGIYSYLWMFIPLLFV